MAFLFAVGGAFFYTFYTYIEAPDPLSVSHLSSLPIVSALAAILVWMGVRLRRDEHASAIGSAFMHVAGIEGDAPQATAMVKVWAPWYYGLLAVTVIIIASLFVFHPVDVTAQIYRGMVVPFFLGLLVPLLTYLSHVSRMIQVRSCWVSSW